LWGSLRSFGRFFLVGLSGWFFFWCVKLRCFFLWGFCHEFFFFLFFFRVWKKPSFVLLWCRLYFLFVVSVLSFLVVSFFFVWAIVGFVFSVSGGPVLGFWGVFVFVKKTPKKVFFVLFLFDVLFFFFFFVVVFEFLSFRFCFFFSWIL